ncbi:MAG TPA: cation diffusion facilitator family transporter [Actinomycetota bacterium]|jgi:cobalt-zinc-cadmium efflux system protein|nr:cation diffusion facilitator family transporter [Actinomycetota bacterium]
MSHDVGRQQRALTWSLAANAGFMVAEFVAGVAFGSLALLADAAHMLSDVGGLGIALFAQSLLSRPPSARHTYGLQRAEVLGALANAITLVAAAVYIFIEAIERIGNPSEVEGGGLLVVAALGLVVNLGSATMLARARGEGLNMRGAYLHMLLDAAGSAGAIVAGIAVVFWRALWADPLMSLLIVLLIVWSAWSLLKDTVHVLLEGAPRGLVPEEIEAAIAAHSGVESVHHLHVWNLASDVRALSAHVVLGEALSLHDAQEQGDRVRTMLEQKFGIEHATLELECHSCEPETATT